MMRQSPGHTKRPTGSAIERGVMAKTCISIRCVSSAYHGAYMYRALNHVPCAVLPPVAGD